MIDGIFRHPTPIYFGRGSAQKALQEIIPDQSRVLIVHGKHSAKETGALDHATAVLKERNIAYLRLGDIRPNPVAEQVYEGIDLCRQHNISFVLAIGGGSVIDTVKSIAIGTPYQGDFFDFYSLKIAPSQSLPIGTILTIAGAGSESSDGAVITKGGQKLSCSNPLMYPRFSALDPGYTVSTPVFLTACGVVDAISHVLERYFSKTTGVSTSTSLCESLIRTLMKNGEALLNNLSDYDLRAEIMWAAKLAHDNTIGFGRKHDWATHTIAHELGARHDKPHGALLAVMFPAWMSHMLQKQPASFARFGREVFGITEPDELACGQLAIKAYRSFLHRMGMPARLSECIGIGIPTNYEAIAQACAATTPSGTIGNFERLSKDEIIQVLQLAEQRE